MTTSYPGNLPDAPNLQLGAPLIARICGQSQPRINDLRRGARERFSLDALVNIVAALARHPITTEGDLMEYTEPMASVASASSWHNSQPSLSRGAIRPPPNA